MIMTKEIKIVLICLAVLVVFVTGFYFYKSSVKLKDVRSSNDVIDKANKEIDSAQITLTKVQLQTICEKLFKAMDGLGTDTDSIYEAIGMANTRSDVLSIIATFGVKDGETLSEWLYGDLSQNEINHLNSILASKNINYQF